MVKRGKNKATGVFHYLNTLNNSKFFAGLVMILMNIGSKYVTIKLSKNQEAYLRNSIGHQMLVFAICWMGTRDIVTALILTTIFIVLTQHLFNEDSRFCILPKKWQEFENVLDLDGDGKVSKDEIAEAIKILEKAKQKK
tara:strand:- start:190 stop:606 length:417 start_codon:yes stop_codon:yes gene_type:complete